LKKITQTLVSLISIFVITLSPMGLDAAYSQRGVRMYDGLIVVTMDVQYGRWTSSAKYTGWNPLGLAHLELQSQVVGRDRVTRFFIDWAPVSANGNKWFVATGGGNSAGAVGNSYARAIGYAWEGYTRRVATAYL